MQHHQRFNLSEGGVTREGAISIAYIVVSALLAYYYGPLLYSLIFIDSNVNISLLNEKIGLTGVRGALFPYAVYVTFLFALSGGRNKYQWVAIAVVPVIVLRAYIENSPLSSARFTDLKWTIELVALWAGTVIAVFGIGSLIRAGFRGARRYIVSDT